MKRIARFEKVSFRQFSDGWDDTFQAIEKGENKDQSKETLKEIYDRIKLPRRATAGSAGYDFFAPVDIILNPGETIKIPTGIRVWMEPEWVLKCYPLSSILLAYVSPGDSYIFVSRKNIPLIHFYSLP